jgi:repressor LexA
MRKLGLSQNMSQNGSSVLSPRQKELFEYIETVSHREHRMPSLREMAKALDVKAVGTIQDHIRFLVQKGFLVKEKKSFRISAHRSCSMITVPVVGTISAGTLTDAFEVALGTVAFSPQHKVKDPSKLLALRVQGESMIDAGIFSGDIAIVDRSRSAKSGDIVVATYNDQATVKELRILGEGKTKNLKSVSDNSIVVELVPHNPKFSVIRIQPDERLEVVGPVVALHRYMG